MNKYELKFCFEEESQKVKDLIEINGKNAFHIQELYGTIKEKEKVIQTLLANDRDWETKFKFILIHLY